MRLRAGFVRDGVPGGGHNCDRGTGSRVTHVAGDAQDRFGELRRCMLEQQILFENFGMESEDQSKGPSPLLIHWLSCEVIERVRQRSKGEDADVVVVQEGMGDV